MQHAGLPAREASHGTLDEGAGSGRIDQPSDSAIAVPSAQLLFHAGLARVRDDLSLRGQNGGSLTVPDYFKSELRAPLISADGAVLWPEVVAAIARPAVPDGAAQAAATPAPEAIGRVTKAEGSTTVVRNGASVQIHAGDAILKTDVLQTGSDSSLALVLKDGTAFNLTADTRFIVGEYTYTDGGSHNQALFHIINGTISFAAGQVAKTGAMKVATPTAIISVRGTTGVIAARLDINNTVQLTVKLYPDADGTVGRIEVLAPNGTLIGTLTQQNTGLVVTHSGPLQAIAQRADLSADQIAHDLNIVQQVFQTQQLAEQILEQLQQQQSQSNNPQPGSGGSKGTQFVLFDSNNPGEQSASLQTVITIALLDNRSSEQAGANLNDEPSGNSGGAGSQAATTRGSDPVPDPPNPLVDKSMTIRPARSDVDENGQSITFTITRADASEGKTVYVSTVQNQGAPNKGDYGGWLNVPLTFAANQASLQVTIEISDDARPEGDERFGLIVQQSPDDPIETHLAATTFTIRDDDVLPEGLLLKPGSEGLDVLITNISSYNDNYGVDGADLRVGGWGDSYHSLLRFDLSDPTLPAHVDAATLRLYSFQYGDYVPTGIYVDKLQTAWTESYGWRDYALSYVNIGTAPAPSPGWIEIDITSAVNDWLANPSANFGMQLRPFGTNHNMSAFVSSDATGDMAQFRPELVLDWTSDPASPAAAMAFLSWAAYRHGLTPELSENLEGSGWAALGPTDLGSDLASRFRDGFYDKEGAAAFAAEKDGIIAISFRGVEFLDGAISGFAEGFLERLGGGALAALMGGLFGGVVGTLKDLLMAGFAQQAYFAELRNFVDKVFDYIDANPQRYEGLYIAGHSLGGMMAEWTAFEYESRIASSGLDVSIATFGSPGTNHPADNQNPFVENIVHFGNADDVVYQHDIGFGTGLVIGDWKREGISFEIDLPNVNKGNVLDFAYEHDSFLYERALRVFAASSFADEFLHGPAGRQLIVDTLIAPGDERILDFTSMTRELLIIGDSSIIADNFTDADVIKGGSAEDWIDGGIGDDHLTGNAGADIFLFEFGDGHDVITDFSGHAGEGDHIRLDGLPFDEIADLLIMATANGQDTVIDLGGDNTILLQGVDTNSLTNDDFIFRPWVPPVVGQM